MNQSSTLSAHDDVNTEQSPSLPPEVDRLVQRLDVALAQQESTDHFRQIAKDTLSCIFQMQRSIEGIAAHTNGMLSFLLLHNSNLNKANSIYTQIEERDRKHYEVTDKIESLMGILISAGLLRETARALYAVWEEDRNKILG